MSKYALVSVKIKSENAPDWGIGKGVISSVKVKLDDDDTIAAIQLNQVGEDLLKNNVHYTFDEITKEEYEK